MFNNAPTSPISKKDQILAALASAKKLIFPKQLHEATGIEKYELGNLLRELRTEGLVLLLENGVYTLTEAGIEKARAEKMQIHPTAKTRAERYKRGAGNVMASPVTTAKQPTEPKKPSRQADSVKAAPKQPEVPVKPKKNCRRATRLACCYWADRQRYRFAFSLTRHTELPGAADGRIQ